MRKITKTNIIYSVLTIIVILTMLYKLYNKELTDVFLCLLTLVLFLIPNLVDKKLNIKIPKFLEINFILFVFASQILGEIKNYYLTFPYWDSMLHTINGFLMAEVGFSLIDILNKKSNFYEKMSISFIIVVSVCFSITVGVMWEFLEFGVDNFLNKDMQKDKIVREISTVELSKDIRTIKNIKKTVIYGEENGDKKEIIIDNGYIDIGIADTMNDLMMNLIGAVVFAIFILIYLKQRDKFTSVFIPRLKN